MEELFENRFSLGTDYKKTFKEEVDKLIKQDLSEDFKKKLIEAITEAYFKQTGERPDSFELSRLATWLVVDKTNDPHKVAKTEYPILSKDQIKLRHSRELVSDQLENRSLSTKHRINGRRKPKNFKVFGEYEGS